MRGRGRIATNKFPSTSRPTPTPTSKVVIQKAETATGNTSVLSNQRVPRWFKCPGLGHIARECPNRQLVTFEDEPTPIYDTENEDEVTKREVEIVDADQGEALITQRLLNVSATLQGHDNLWLRNNIFHTKCTTEGKVCNVIIYGGSCENMVATSMVEKLGLDVENHPTPYQLRWLKKGNIKVTKTLFGSFLDWHEINRCRLV